MKKKILFASTALAAAGLLDVGTALAADPISLSLGGYSRWWVVGQWNSPSFERAYLTTNNLAGTPTQSSYDNVDVKGDNQIFIGGKTTLDNGIKVGADVHFWAGGNTIQTTDSIDRAYAYVEGGFGRFMIGTQKNGTYLLHVQAPDAAGNWGEMGMLSGNQAIVQPNAYVGSSFTGVHGMAGGNTTAINTTNNAEALTYVTPTFGGLTLGASYLPHGGQTNSVTPFGSVNLNQTGVGASSGTGVPLNNYIDGGIQQVYGGGALYAHQFGSVGIKASAGAVSAKLSPEIGGGWLEQSYGAQVTYGGFTVGGSYRHQQSDNTNLDVGQLGNITSWPGGSFSNGSAYDAGIQYATGPYAVSFAYFHSAVQNCDNSFRVYGGVCNNGHDMTDIYQVSGKYNLGPGVDALASAGFAGYTSANSGDANRNAGWTLMSGLALGF